MRWIKTIAGGLYIHLLGFDLFVLKNFRRRAKNTIFDVNKSLSYFPEEIEDLKIYRRCLGQTDMIWTDNIYKQLRVLSFLQLVRMAAHNNGEGAFLELGVWKGLSSLMIANILRKEIISEQTIILVDSFEGGLSEKKPQDKNLVIDQSVTQVQKEKWQFASQKEDVAFVMSNFRNVVILEGWVPEILHQLDVWETFAFVHFDMDLFEPTEKALVLLWERILPKGVLVFDDYNSTQFPGVTEAVRKFAETKQEEIEIFFEVPFGSAWIVKR